MDDEGEPDEPGAEDDTMVEDSAIAHMTDDDETLKMIGLKLGIPAPRLLEINKPLIKGLRNIHQKMKEGTRILLRAEPQVEDGGGKRRRTGGKSKGGGKATVKAKGAAGGAAVDHASAWVHPAVFFLRARVFPGARPVHHTRCVCACCMFVRCLVMTLQSAVRKGLTRDVFARPAPRTPNRNKNVLHSAKNAGTPAAARRVRGGEQSHAKEHRSVHHTTIRSGQPGRHAAAPSASAPIEPGRQPIPSSATCKQTHRTQP